MISCARNTMSTARSNECTSNVPSARRNFIRLSDARLHAESSTCMYSEHGFEALIRPDTGLVCQLLIVVSYWTPGSAQRHAASAIALHQMNSRMSGWSTSSTTIFAARRVPPPDLIEPAHASAPRMNETGPDAVPPRLSGSIEPRIFDKLIPEPEPPRKMIPSLVFHSRIDSISSSTERMKHALAWHF